MRIALIPGIKPLTAPTNPLGIKSIYANNVELNASNVDVRMMFNEIIVDHANAITVERRANVVMSMQHFFLFKQVLDQFAAKLADQMKAAADAAKAQAAKK